MNGSSSAASGRSSAQHRAGADKESKDAHKGYKVVMPPDKFIPLSVSDIIDAMRMAVRHEDRTTFTQICQLVEGCATAEFATLRRRVKKNYRFFAQAAMQRDLPTRKGRGIKKEGTMDEMELTFLNDFWELMDIAHYKCCTEADWLAIKQERLMLDMPLKVGWHRLDDRLLTRFFERHPDRRHGLYRHQARALMFHRGVGVKRIKDFFITQKIDLLVNYLIAWPSKQVFYQLAPHLWKSAKEKAHSMAMHDRMKATNPNDVQTEAEAAEPHHPNAQVLTRISLRTLMPTYSAVLTNLFKQCEIVEPTYKDIIILYRKSVEPPSEKELKSNAKAGENFRRDRRGIFVKRFDEVPVADVEIVFPDKEIGLKLLDKLILGATALSAILGCLWAVIRNAVELSVLLSIATTFGGKLYQSYATMQRKKADLSKQVAQKVFDVSMDAQEGALYSVLDEMSDQVVKEQLLAYFLLLKHKYPVSEDELDELCESFLADRFEVKVDFAIEESLPRLLQDGLARHAADDADPRLAAALLDDAHAHLLDKWQTVFAYDEEGDSLGSAISQPFYSAGHAVSSVSRFVGKAAAIVPGAGALGIGDESAGKAKKPKRKRKKLKDLFKSKKEE